MTTTGLRTCNPDCSCRTPETATVGWGRVKWEPAEDGLNALYVFTGLKFEPVAHFADEENAEDAVKKLRRALEDAILCERAIKRRQERPSEKTIRERMQEPDEHPQHEPPAVPAVLPMPQIPEEAPPSKNAAAVHLGRRGGKKGGFARAEKLSKEQRSEIARKAAAARWSKARPKSQEVDKRHPKEP